MAAPWDVVAMLANLAQLSGLHALTVIAVCARVLRIPQSRRECAQLERCARTLRGLLQWPTAGFVLQRSVMGNRVGEALDEAASLVDSFHRSTLWRRVRCGRTMTARFREMQSIINSYCWLVISINGLLLVQAAAATTRPPRSYSNNTTVDVSEQEQVPPSPRGAESFASPDDIPVLVMREECAVSQIVPETDNTVFDRGCEIVTSNS